MLLTAVFASFLFFFFSLGKKKEGPSVLSCTIVKRQCHQGNRETAKEASKTLDSLVRNRQGLLGPCRVESDSDLLPLKVAKSRYHPPKEDVHNKKKRDTLEKKIHQKMVGQSSNHFLTTERFLHVSMRRCFPSIEETQQPETAPYVQ